MSNNQKTVTVKITRDELINLLLCTMNAFAQEPRPKKWLTLHNKLHEQLKQYDSKHMEEVY